MRRITTRQELRQFAREQGVRHDWHEPDEQDLTARVEGISFDNCGTWPAQSTLSPEATELHVVFSRTEWPEGGDGPVPVEDLACVNLATLCAWAAEAASPGAEMAL